MKKFIQKASRGTMGAYLRFLVLLLLVSAMILVAMTVSGCGNCNKDTYVVPRTISMAHWPTLVGPGSVPPGGRVNLEIHPSPGAGKRYIEWMPPEEATNFQFPGTQPEPGGPPFGFPNVDESDDLRMSYTAPSQAGVLVDMVGSYYSDASYSASSLETVVGSGAAARSPVSAAPRPALARPLAQAQVGGWEVMTWLNPTGITLTTELCQEWLAKLQGDEFFLAARMPMATTAVTSSYRLPFVFGGPYSQTLSLREYSQPTILTATLEYRPERHTFLANELPQAAGERWAALGISTTEPITCPTGLNVPMGNWTIAADLLLDLHDQTFGCADCTILVYGCYEGQESPLASLAVQALDRTLGLESYQGEGITCLGPSPIHLTPVSGLDMSGSAAAVITPTQPISLHEGIVNYTGYPVTLTLAYTSSVGGWQFYGGDWDAPDTNKPIIPGTTEIVIPGEGANFSDIWAVNASVPADTEAGPHSLVITVTSPIFPFPTTWDAIPLWSGGWVAPPPPLETRYWIYLPLALRNR